ncbi:RelE toxin [Pseudomonas cichorii]|uniref:Type II toxin-antitoxin system RelE/ParE family toxin n=1 Tax=Pseudomonas serbiensis TaxID=3064350 RepID=A0ABT9CVG9_9PSED|nr:MULTISPECIES: type II toxin-antitoxin system RelE/ParE family toxin [Pseudomonas]MDO7929489.1 type II toxin-antitoxin system RelE/ParE family toxin [Pseudomonas sp. KFB-138]GFM87590.1 RelE toxin [Pseudomonas cichorii]
MTSSPRQRNDKSVSHATGTYTLEFLIEAKKEYDDLDKTVQLQLLKKLRSRLLEPKVQADKLRDMPGCYKIKLRASGIRLVYEVIDARLVVSVIAVGRRDHEVAYQVARKRLN